MTKEEFETLVRLYAEFKDIREDIFQTLRGLTGVEITGMTPINKIDDGPVLLECVRLAFKLDKKAFWSSKEERDRMCASAARRRHAEIQAEEDALERGRERNRIEQERQDERKERELYARLKKKFS